LISTPFVVNDGATFEFLGWTINSPFEAIIVMLFGVFMLPFALRLFSAMGDMWRGINEALLDDPDLHQTPMSKRKAVLYGESRYDDDPFDDYGYTDEKPKRTLGDLLDDNFSSARR
ncbi:MAG: hypothetical protein RLP44_19160, partial [Aggregatilineales bacterium]